jgi:hypothetical protein
MTMRTMRLSVIAAAALLPSGAEPHAVLTSPTPRMSLTSKTAPCGAPRTPTSQVFTAGQEIEVRWEEYIDHPGYYRLLFSLADDRNFQVLLDRIPDKAPSGGSAATYAVTVRLPSTPCEKGTLQLIQVMTENPQFPSLYYSCADIRLEAPSVTPFRRGDANLDGATDIADPVATLEQLFRDAPLPACLDAADANDDGQVDISDVLGTLLRLFQDAPAAPPPLECGLDPTGDLLACGEYPACEN